MSERKTNPEVRSVLIPEDLWEWLGEYSQKKGRTSFHNDKDDSH